MSLVSQWWGRTRSLFGGGASSHGDLSVEVNACLTVIKTLEHQIEDAALKGTNATDELSQAFGEMANQAQAVVQSATGSQQGDSVAGVDQIREVMSDLLAQVRETNRWTHHTADKLTDVENDLQDVEDCIAQIEGIANRSRMVSLNGQIEAARAQEHGDGFAVVASETGDLAQNVSVTSQDIRSVVDRMAQSLRRTSEETKAKVREDSAAIAACEEKVDAMLKGLASYQNELESNLASTKQSSDQLASAISRAIMTLQFQDGVSQRLHHVSETLSEVRDTVGPIAGPETPDSKRREEEWIEHLAAGYCVDDERLVLTGQTAGDLEQSHSSNVELF
ncbi:MAG: methyl-accepting chemotaxis protein [Planctomycetota bacterium]